jgi:hypothetical protein
MLADLLDKHRHVADGCPHAMKKSKPVSIRVNNVFVPDGDILVPIPPKELRFVSGAVGIAGFSKVETPSRPDDCTNRFYGDLFRVNVSSRLFLAISGRQVGYVQCTQLGERSVLVSVAGGGIWCCKKTRFTKVRRESDGKTKTPALLISAGVCLFAQLSAERVHRKVRN